MRASEPPMKWERSAFNDDPPPVFISVSMANTAAAILCLQQLG
jgi:hypothetical protein